MFVKEKIDKEKTKHSGICDLCFQYDHKLYKVNDRLYCVDCLHKAIK